MHLWYKLNPDHSVTPIDSPTDTDWIGADRVVKRETVAGADVSTVFLMLDHNMGGRRPLLFETLVFGGKLDGEMMRCSTWDEAVTMHASMCHRVYVAETE